MSDLISTMVTQLNQIPPSVYDNSGLLQTSENIQHNIVEQQVNNEDEEITDNRIVVDLDDNNDADNEEVAIEELDDDSWDSEEEDDDDNNSKKLTINDKDFDVVIESINVDENTDDINNVANNMTETIIEDALNTTVTLSNGDTKVIETSSVDVDYSKMQVAMLKKMVAERNLAQGVSKMKKQELIDVLMKQ